MTNLRDNPRGWTNGYTKAPEFDRAAFQKQIDEICGKGVLRLVFGAEEEVEQAAMVGNFGQILETRRVGRYQTRIRGTIGNVRINRWIIEQFEKPEQFEDAPFVRIPGMSGLFVPPEIAEARVKGAWKLVNVIADHSKCPANICDSKEYFCFGDYREPSERDLNAIREQTQEREKWAAKQSAIILPDDEEYDYE